MKNSILQVIILLIILVFYACRANIKSNTGQVNTNQMVDYQAKGDSVALLAQQTFVKALTKAIADSGTHYAVKFCNLNAQTLIQDLEKANNCKIGRISDKTRQPLNAAKDDIDKKMLTDYALSHQSSQPMDSKVVQDESLFKYYRPITIGMPACLKCHGQVEQDIDAKTRQIIQEKYPKDLATGYQLKDFRGLWKIVFKR
ncbi:MAG: DUF3365 domain-containing protein [Microscillaceae bacterium]|jgi:hypothetical protein|nr:DUF3365 domain-containing protein [Microscillaceae bacterium]